MVMSIQSVVVIALAYLLLPLSTTSAAACADGLACAVVRETQDGFAALRDRASKNGTLRAKLKPYEIVVVFRSDCRPNRAEDPWTEVVCVPRLDRDCENSEAGTKGWVSTSLIEETWCPVDLN
jgi:hypothetical protein